jgi:hypothetical protein
MSTFRNVLAVVAITGSAALAVLAKPHKRKT